MYFQETKAKQSDLFLEILEPMDANIINNLKLRYINKLDDSNPTCPFHAVQ